ncbi:MAG: C10 family peptidase [Bacteroidales bacterium]
MKNRFTYFISLLTAFILVCQVSFAEIVTSGTALLVAKNVFYERVNLVKENTSYQSIKFSDAIIISRNSIPVYYVFNCVSEAGFVIVSAESNTMPVLAYSFENYFNVNNLNESVEETMENYINEISAIREKNLKADEEIIAAWGKYSATNFQKSTTNITTVGPLTKTTWDQSCYYNTLCPTAAGGDCNHAYTGCVATAMAQIMKFWSYPTKGVGSNSYTSIVAHNVNFANQTYNWSAMPLNLTAENNEVAKIIYHAGVSVNMSYSAGGSSAFTQTAADELISHFKYSTTTQYVNKASYSNVNWHILIRSNLIDGRPVMYRGTGSQGGHSFILDGFQYPEFYHINWGWGGSHNAYFYLNSLNSGNGDFTTDQGAVINCYPSSAAANTTGIKENNQSNEIKISPNPNNGQFSLVINNAIKGDLTVTVMDISSRVILKKTINKEFDVITESIIVPELCNGFYFVAVEGNQFKSVNKFIVK